jgi:phage-related protein
VQHQTDYNTGKPAAFDAKTTALMPFAGHLKAYTRRLTVETVDGAWVLQPTGGVILEGSDLPVLPDYKEYTEEADQLHGELDFGGILRMRKFDFIVDARKANADKFAYLRDLAYWLNPHAGYQELIWDDDPVARCLLVRVAGGISYANKINAVKFRVPFKGKPFMESLATHWAWLDNSSGSIENQGNEEAPPLITFYDAAVNPSIAINGVTVQYTGSLVAGDCLEIDTGAKTAKHTTGAGVVTNVLGGMGANWPLLQPGWNYIASAFFCSVSWRDRWV